MTPTLEVRSNPRCLEHRPGLGHPEGPERVNAVLEALELPTAPGWKVVADSPLPPEGDILGVLKWIHDTDHIERVRAASEKGSGWLDSHDCAVSPGTFRSAVAAAGLALQAGLDLANRRLQRAFVLTRPPSHHAERGKARGYCFFNAVALAAEVVVRSWNRPVLVVDFDAWHGNGTQQYFHDRGDVGFLSVHRYPGFPGGGTADETGAGEGEGLTRNIPLAEGADDAVFCAAFERGLADMAALVQPAALVVSAGFNGHADDPAGGLTLTEEGYRRISRALARAAEDRCEGRILSFLEGGFAPPALAACALAHVEELAGTADSGTDARLPVN
jgi:acetoin utilization deacetylase AcuC-like enzyme